MNIAIPQEIQFILKQVQEAGFDGYIVGGCVRDLLLNKEPKDWDITTNAKPDQIQKIFPESVYENQFGTVAVKTNSTNDSLKIIEITTFRLEGKYSDKRHPDQVKFAKTLKEDLARRDFTINAMAIEISSQFAVRSSQKIKNCQLPTVNCQLIDLFDGQKDLKNRTVRTVGEPKERLNEDALRLIRAPRLAVELDFTIEPKTFEAIKEDSRLIKVIAKERIKDELIKIIASPRAEEGILLLQKTGLLKYIIPELEQGVGVSQNRSHIYTVFQHSLLSLKYAAQNNFNLEVRFAALFHDIAKPQTKRGEGTDATFYSHDVLGAKIAKRTLSNLKFPVKITEKVALLVKNHMFISDPDKITEAGARRLIRRAGPENMQDLINLRIADRLGMGVPKARPYRLRKLEYLIEKVSCDPISVKMLNVNGNDIMEILSIEPGPKIGAILDVLLAEVIEEPQKNKKEELEKRLKELNKEDLDSLRKLAKEKVQEKKEEEDLKIKKKYWVK